MDSKNDKQVSPGDASAQNASSSTRPGSVGAVSQEIGYDVRDLIMMGFTPTEIIFFPREEIMSVVEGKRTLQQLRSEYKASGQNKTNQQSQETADLESDDS